MKNKPPLTITRTQEAINSYYEGDLKNALRIAKDFRLGISDEDRSTMTVGYEMLVDPKFYVSLKLDPDTEIEKAREVFRIQVAKEHEAKCPKCGTQLQTLAYVMPPKVWECGCGQKFTVEKTVSGIISVPYKGENEIDRQTPNEDQLTLF